MRRLPELVAETLGVGMHIDSKFSLEMFILQSNHSCHVINFGSDSDEDFCFPDREEEEKPQGTCQMQLRGGKSLPERQPPKPKDKGKEKL
jgi:hypothetical protein